MQFAWVADILRSVCTPLEHLPFSLLSHVYMTVKCVVLYAAEHASHAGASVSDARSGEDTAAPLAPPAPLPRAAARADLL